MRIVLIGAGSVEFTRNLLGDILSYPELADAEIVLHDIDADRLRTAERMAAYVAEELGAKPRVETHLDRRAALPGADVVIDTIQVGGAAATKVDFDIPAQYGLRYTINDTINVGGVMRGLRTVPVVLGIVRDMEELCPDAWFLNYTNPMAILVRAVAERSEIRTTGLCHSVFWTIDALARYMDVPRDEIDHVTAGVNHLAWVLKLERDGVDLYPALRAAVDAGRVPAGRPGPRRAVPAIRLLPDRVLGAPRRVQPVVHPQGRPRRAVQHPDRRIPRPGRQQPRRVRGHEAPARRRRAIRDRAQRRVRGRHRPLQGNGRQARIVGNVMNGDRLIPNLADDACVEVPCDVDGSGVHPIATGPLPAHLAAYVHPAVDTQALTVRAALDEDREAIYHAVLCDPQVQARLTLDEAWRMTDALIGAEARWLPGWLGGAA